MVSEITLIYNFLMLKMFCIDNLPKALALFQVNDGSRLKVDDFLQNYQLYLNIVHKLVGLHYLHNE